MKLFLNELRECGREKPKLVKIKLYTRGILIYKDWAESKKKNIKHKHRRR